MAKTYTITYDEDLHEYLMETKRKCGISMGTMFRKGAENYARKIRELD